MQYDLAIRGGTVIDGTGAPGMRADVGVRNGRIETIGTLDDSATRTVDASGCIVTPGFVDLHTHYDGQISWDAEMAPSVFHGVTTAVLGNCGVGFAPVRANDRETLIALMEGVEDIPGAALHEGLRWRWESFPEYMRAVDDFPHTIDFALQVPHDALRVFVMGARGVKGEAATESDLASIRALLREALLEGAVGFSTGRSDNHRSRTGAATPASEASIRELEVLASAFEGLRHGVIQAVSDFDMEQGPERFDPEFDVLERMARAASGHALSISLSQRDMAPDQWRRILARVEAANAAGIPMRVQVAPRAIGVMLGLQATFHPFIGFPSYKAIAHLPLEERVRVMRDPAFKTRVLSEQSEPVAGDGSPVPPMVDRFIANIGMVAMRLFRLGERPNYEPTPDDSLAAEALARNVGALEILYDAMLEDDGRQLLYFPVFNYTEFSLDNVHTMLTHAHALAGLSDGGAHVGTVCDASFPTFLLTHWVRDRARGRIPLERAIRMLAGETAGYAGFRDRGVLKVGLRADLNVIDLERLAVKRPRMVRDFPAGGQRLLQDASGYRATVVRGEVVVENDRLTSARPGRLARITA
jgi:N-acyl-D-aspartate/D-glutamate deacylase